MVELACVKSGMHLLHEILEILFNLECWPVAGVAASLTAVFSSL